MSKTCSILTISGCESGQGQLSVLIQRMKLELNFPSHLILTHIDKFLGHDSCRMSQGLFWKDFTIIDLERFYYLMMSPWPILHPSYIVPARRLSAAHFSDHSNGPKLSRKIEDLALVRSHPKCRIMQLNRPALR